MSSAVPQRPYTFHIASSWAGKPELPQTFTKTPFAPNSPIGAWRDKMLTRKPGSSTEVWYPSAGEDFFFIQEMKNASGVSFGVADGVGGWVDSGIDPSLFSQALMYHAHRYTRNAWAGEPEIDPTLDYAEREEVEGWELTPYECLDLAFGGVCRERLVQAGSSTAVLLSLNASSGLLRTANLGDSGFLIIRSSSVFYRQAVQTHFLNCPFQLTKLPAKDVRRFSRACIDSPSAAAKFETTLRHGDIIIAYTDGLSDNVFPSEILNIVSLVGRSGLPESSQAQSIADRLISHARHCMFNKYRVSPFEQAAARDGKFFRGGKIDDVTVVVAIVNETL
ncbi:protein serine/threonine phosphatase 2C [Hymenopellis radicata]|nr:protein serine/threonine phosphatase 2C [Hymenopellis radicata]